MGIPGGVTASTVFDVQGKVGALPAGLTRLTGSGVVAGPALTVACAEGSVSGVVEALARAQPRKCSSYRALASGPTSVSCAARTRFGLAWWRW